MNFSSKDKRILSILGIFIIVISYWNLFLNPHLKSISKLNKDIVLNNNLYSLNLEYLEKNNSVDSELKILNQRIQDIHKQFPPELNYDEVFMVLKNLSISSGIKISSFTFKGKGAVNYDKTNSIETGATGTTSTTDTTNASGMTDPSGGSSNAENTVSQSSNIGGSGTNLLDETGKKIMSFLKESGLDEGIDESLNEGNNKGLSPGQGFELSTQLKSTGSMNQIKKFMGNLESMENRIKYGDIQISKGKKDELNFSATIIFLGIYSKNSSGSGHIGNSKWNPNKIENRNNIFDVYKEFPDKGQSGQNTQNTQNTISSSNTNTKDVLEKSLDEISKYDFTMRVMPYGNNIAPPTVTLTAKNAINLNDYMYPVVYGDSSGQENVEIYFEENKGKVYFKFKTANESFPDKQFQSLAEFKPNAGEIRILVDSTPRKYKTDISSVSLIIKNNTKRNILVDVLNEDKSQPRVKFENMSENVKINY